MKEARWVRRLCASVSTAWAQLIAHWSPRLYSYVLYNVESEGDAQALVQVIFAEIVQAVVGSLRIANLTILLFSIARRHVLRYRARQVPGFSPSHPHLLATDSTNATENQQSASFWACFQQFTPELQQVLLLHYLCGVSLPEISQIVGRREEELLRVLHRAQSLLLRT